MLCRLSYTAVLSLEARGGVEPRAFPPDSCRFGLEDRRRERGPAAGGDGEIRTHTLLFTGQLLLPVGATSPLSLWPGREAVAPLRTPRSHQSPFCRDESRPDNLLGLVPKEGLKPSTSGL